MKKHSVKKLKKWHSVFCGLRTTEDLARLLKTKTFKLELLAREPVYYTFTVPKKDGSKRWIENPQSPLKKIQRKLNKYLQAVVYHTRTTAAYGFMTVAANDPDPRHILSNAQRHLNCQYLLNADIEDFFHQVKFEKVFQLFSSLLFQCSESLVELLTQLVTHKGRLPMGAPTSPAISNLVCISMDNDLIELSVEKQWTYTRYADDLSFSSLAKITSTDFATIEQIIQKYGFSFNPEKVKHYGPDLEKEITGLIVSDEVSIPDTFIGALKNELQKLANVVEVQQRTGGHSSWVNTYQYYVQGKLAFVKQIMGPDDEISEELEETYEAAIDPPDQFESVRWLDFPYR